MEPSPIYMERIRQELELQKYSEKDIGLAVEAVILVYRIRASSDRYSLIEDIEKLLRHLPLTPLTGDESEWVKSSTPGTELNWRATRVERRNGVAFDTQAYGFRTDDGETYINEIDSAKEISFPYEPVTEIVESDL